MTEIDGSADLDRRLADALGRLEHGMRALAQRSARGHGLSPLQQQIVLALAKQPANRREVSVLAAEFDVTRPTMSDAVSALERKELVMRSPSADGRRRLLTLTSNGDDFVCQLEMWDGPLLEALSELPIKDRATTLHSLLHVIANLQRKGAISVARICTTCRFFEPDAYSDPVAPHHCHLLRAPLPLAELQTDCREHKSAIG